MSIKIQCGYCLHMMALPDTLTGRKILCPLCDDPIQVDSPPPSGGFKPFHLKEAIPRLRLNDWDKAFAAAILSEGVLEEKTLFKALVAFVKASRKNPEIALSENLTVTGVLTAQQRDDLRVKLKGKVNQAQTTFVECPNCFANIDSTCRACKFCGQSVGDTRSLAICPNCKADQPREKAHCGKCGADMKTGLLQNQKSCPGCSRMVRGDPAKCPYCKAIIKTRKDRRRQKESAFQEQRTKQILAAVAAVVLLLGGWLLYGAIQRTFRYLSVGGAQVALEDRMADLGSVLQARDMETLNDYVLDGPGAEDTLKLLCTGHKTKEHVKTVRTVEVQTLTLDEAQKEAKTEVRVLVRLEPAKESSGEELGMRSVFTSGELREYDLQWTWVRKDGVWLLKLP